MVQINADYYEDLDAASFARVLNGFSAGRTPRPGPQIDRQFSAPVGGPTTLTDPDLYAAGREGGRAGGELADAKAKKPGEPANIRDAPVPKPPAADSSRA
jgi:NADH-quinone oxidoreductase subunit E